MRPPHPAVDVEELLVHAEGIRRLARRLVGNEPDADDLAQDAFGLAVARAPRRGWPLGSWLGGVVRNLARERSRGDRRRRVRETRAARPEPTPAVDELVEGVEMQRLVLGHVVALDPPHRSVVILRYLKGLPPPEVAHVLDLPVETVRTRLKRALARLRASLDAAHGGDRRTWATALALGDPRRSPLGSSTVAAKVVAATLVAGLAGVGLWSWTHDGPRESPRDEADDARAALGTRPASLHGAPGLARPDGGAAAGPAFASVDRDLDLHGVVVREDGRPVAGANAVALVFPWRKIPGGERRSDEVSEVARATTGTDGSFALRLPRGTEATLRATAPGLARREMVHCQPGQRTRVVMRDASVLVVSVVDAAGTPVADADVDVWRETANTAEPMLERSRGRTDASGSWRCEDMAQGSSVGVAVRHAAHASPDPIRSRELVSGENAVRLVMARGRTVAGRVVDAATREPIRGARLATNGSAGTPWVGHPATTDADGRFAVDGWSTRVLGRMGVEAAGYEPTEVDVPPAGRELLVELARGVGVRARVVGADGSPVAGARVGARPQAEETEWSSGAADRAVESDAEGRVFLGGLLRDRIHALTVVADGLPRVTLDVPRRAGSGDVIEVGDVVLGGSGRIDGRLRTEEGAPVEGAEVTLHGGNADRGRLLPAEMAAGTDVDGRVTDDLGRFGFTDLAPGDYTVSVRTRGNASASRDVAVGAADVATVELRVASGRRLAVSVRDTWRAPVAACPFVVRSGSGANVRGVTGDGGDAWVQVPDYARVVEVDPAWASAHGYRPAAPRDVPPLPTTWLQVEAMLEFDAGVEGTVLDPDGSPLPGAYVVARTADRWVGTFSDDAGRFTVGAPRDASLSLELTGLVRRVTATKGAARSKAPAQTNPERRPIAASLEGVRVGAEDVVLRARALDVDRTFRFVVLDPDGAPLGAARVAVEGYDRESSTDAAGRATLGDLPARPLRLVVLLDETRRGLGWCQPLADTWTPDGSEVVLRMRRAAVVEGVVLGPTGRPVPGAEVTATQAAQSWTQATADDAGRFTFRIDPDRFFPVRLSAYRSGQGVGSLRGSHTLDGPPIAPVTISLSKP